MGPGPGPGPGPGNADERMQNQAFRNSGDSADAVNASISLRRPHNRPSSFEYIQLQLQPTTIKGNGIAQLAGPGYVRDLVSTSCTPFPASGFWLLETKPAIPHGRGRVFPMYKPREPPPKQRSLA